MKFANFVSHEVSLKLLQIFKLFEPLVRVSKDSYRDLYVPPQPNW